MKITFSQSNSFPDLFTLKHNHGRRLNMFLNVWVLVSIAIFYVIITVIGIWSARLKRKKNAGRPADTLIVGHRDIGLLLGICTVTASWIGGGAVNGTAETVYSPSSGLVWCVAPVAYGLSLIIGGVFFAKKMRDKNCITVLDPIEEKLGRRFVVVYFCLEMLDDIIYTSAILNALGSTLEVIAGISRVPSVISSAAIATLYTLLGGIYSVAYTDVVQLAFMMIGLVITIPFALSHDAVSSIGDSFLIDGGWLGKWDSKAAGPYVDTILLGLFGGVPLQSAFQRFLAIDTTANTRIVSVASSIFSTILLIPPVLIGAIGTTTNWTMTEYLNGSGVSPADVGDEVQILPLVVQYLTPPTVGIFGLGAITAAVMSSADSTGLAFGAVFGNNLYKAVVRPKASQEELVWAIRGSIVIFGIVAATVALKIESVMTLYILSADFTYILTWPQFVCSLYLEPNVYGSIFGIILGVILRIGGGEYFLDIPAPFNYVGGYKFPVKTCAMVSTFLSTVIVSYLVRWLFRRKYVPNRFDLLNAFRDEDGCVAKKCTKLVTEEIS